MTNLYEKNREAFDNLAASGKPHIAEMAKRFRDAFEMDKALGVRGVAGKWASGRNGASQLSDTAARIWLENNRPDEPEPQPEPKAAGTMLLIACPAGLAPKIERLATMLGCEVTEF